MNKPSQIPENGFYYHYKHDQKGEVNNYAEVVRRALVRYEEEAVNAVLESHKEAMQEKILRGDLDHLTKEIVQSL